MSISHRFTESFIHLKAYFFYRHLFKEKMHSCFVGSCLCFCTADNKVYERLVFLLSTGFLIERASFSRWWMHQRFLSKTNVLRSELMHCIVSFGKREKHCTRSRHNAILVWHKYLFRQTFVCAFLRVCVLGCHWLFRGSGGSLGISKWMYGTQLVYFVLIKVNSCVTVFLLQINSFWWGLFWICAFG